METAKPALLLGIVPFWVLVGDRTGKPIWCRRWAQLARWVMGQLGI